MEPSAGDLHRRAGKAREEGRYHEALALELQCTRALPESPPSEDELPRSAWLALGGDYAKLGDYVRAVRTYEQLVERFPRSREAARALVEISNIYYWLGQPEAVAEVAERVSGGYQQFDREARTARDRLSWATRARPERALVAESSGAAATLRLARRLLKQGARDRALVHYQELFERYGSVSLAHTGGTYLSGRTVALADLGDVQEARRAYRKRFAEDARRGLAEATDEDGLLGVYRRYPFTDAARAALQRYSRLLLERGAYRQALAACSALKRDFELTPEEVQRLDRQVAFLEGEVRRSTRESAPALAPGAGGLGVAWRVPIRRAPEADLNRWKTFPNPREPRPHRPLVVGGKVLFQSAQHVEAVDVRTGEVLWRFRPQRPGISTPRGWPERSGFPVYQVAEKDGSVFVRLPWAPLYSGRAKAEIGCLSAATGEVLWTTAGDTLWQDFEFLGTPLVVDDVVFVLAARKFSSPVGQDQLVDFFLAGLDARTGRRRSSLYLSSATLSLDVSGAWATYIDTVGAGATVALADGTLYCQTNAGCLAAVDLLTGGLEWLYSYPRDIISGSSPRQTLNIFNRDVTRPLTVGELLLVLPQDTHKLIALTRSTGELLWQQPLVEAYTWLGPTENSVWVGGRWLYEVDLADGEVLRQVDVPGGQVLGRVLPAGEGYVLGTPSGLYRFAPAAGALTEVAEAPAGLGNLARAPGGFLGVTGDELLLVSPTRQAASAPPKRVETPVAQGRPSAVSEPMDPEGPLTVAWSWKRPDVRLLTPDDGSRDMVLLYASGELRAYAPGGRGKLRWRAEVPAGLRRCRWLPEALVLVYGSGVVLVERRTGRVRWRYDLEPDETGFEFPWDDYSEITGVVADEAGVYLVQRYRLVALDASTGERRWRKRLSHPSYALGDYADALVNLEHGRPSELVARSKETGNVLWKVEVPLSEQYWYRVRFDGDHVFVTGNSGRYVRTYDLSQQREVWSVQIPRLYDYSWPPMYQVMKKAFLVIGRSGDRDYLVKLFDRTSGEVLFSGSGYWSYVEADGSRAYFHDRQQLTAIDDRGSVLWRTKFGTNGDPVGKGVLMTSDQRYLYAATCGAAYNHPWQGSTTERVFLNVLRKGTGEKVRTELLPTYNLRQLWSTGEVLVVTGPLGAYALIGAEDDARYAGRVPEFRSVDTGSLRRARERVLYRRAVHYQAQKVLEPPTIDGDLSDWPESAFVRLDRPVDWLAEEGGALSEEDRRWRGPEDLSARVAVRWDDSNLYVSIEVVDDVWHQPFPPGRRWLGDSVLLGIDRYNAGMAIYASAGYRDSTDEYLLAHQDGAFIVDRTFGGLSLNDVRRAARIDPARRSRSYELAFPWERLRRGRNDRPDRAYKQIGLDVAVADNDGHGLKGALEWGGGLVPVKFPRLFIPVELSVPFVGHEERTQ